MKTKALNLFLILTFGLVMNCDNDNTDMPELNVRVSNVSQFNFENIEIAASIESGNTNIEKLNSGQMTEYMTFKKAQLFPHIELQIEGKTYTIKPYSTGFEDIINSGGNYTYQIDANENQEQYEKLSFDLINEL